MAGKDVQYVVQENGFYYVAGKAMAKSFEILVSSKGIANGLSEEYNDGYDFGPDSYNPSVTSGVPLTQTVGIMEAINYASTTNQKIKITSGVFDINTDFAEMNDTNSYGLINLPYNPATSTSTPNPIFIEMEGTYGVWGAANGNPDGTPVPTNGTVLYFHTPSSIPPSTETTALAAINGGTNGFSNYVFLLINHITFRTDSNPKFRMFQLGAVAGVSMENVRVDINYAINSNIGGSTTTNPAPPQPTSTIAIGIDDYSGGAQNRGLRRYVNILVEGFYIGFKLNVSQFSEYQNLYTVFCYYGFQIGKGGSHGLRFGNIGTLFNTYPILLDSAIIAIEKYADNAYTDDSSEWYYEQYTINSTTSTANSNYLKIMHGTIVYPTFSSDATASTLYEINSEYLMAPQHTYNGTTAGTWSDLLVSNTSYNHKEILYFNGYENDTATNQSSNFVIAFTTVNGIVANTTGLTITASLTGITITAPDNTTTYSGIVIVEGY